MNPLSLLKKISFRRISRKKLSKESIVMAGCIISAVLFILILIWDGYIFWASSQPPENAASQTSDSFSEKDIDEAVIIVNKRQQEFTEALGTTP